jgi:CRP-like cAMP-binding protein
VSCRGQHPQFITSVVTALQLEYYAPGDLVVRQGDMGDAMYFLAQGSLEVSFVQGNFVKNVACVAQSGKASSYKR